MASKRAGRPSRWPVIDLVELTEFRRRARRKRRLMAPSGPVVEGRRRAVGVDVVDVGCGRAQHPAMRETHGFAAPCRPRRAS